MSDSLKIFGINYTGVIGIKATDTSDAIKTYVRPEGTKSITSNGVGIDVTSYASVDVNVSSIPSLQTKTKTYTPTTSQQTETIVADSGYDGLGSVEVTVNAMATGSVTAPSSISENNATVSPGTNTLTLTKTVSVTPNVISAGYVSAGTSGNTVISLSANVTTKSAATIVPTTTNQTINSGTYLTGNQVISGDANLVATNIKEGVSIFGITGTFSGNTSAYQLVTGTFTTGTTYGVQSLDIDTNATGYPVFCAVYVEGGAYNSSNTTWYNSTQRYAIGQWTMSKSVEDTTPTYATSGTQNQGVTAWIYKNSASSATSYNRSSAMNTNVYSSSNPTSAGATCIRFSGNKTLKYYVMNTSYGLHQQLTYRYMIIYKNS